MRLPKWLKRRRERRKSVRMAVEGLCAIYWEGSAGSYHRISEISVDGAVVETKLNWYRGTLIRMSIQDTRDGIEHCEIPLSDLWSRVVRGVNGGICVQFLFASGWERREFRKFLGTFDRRLECEPNKLRARVAQRAGAD
jgi:hypothetical protein